MTPAGPGRPHTALDLLFDPGEDAPHALARQLLSGDADLGRALENLPKVTREAAVREASTAAAGLLDADLIGVILAGWREHRDITSAARRTLAAPGSSELVSLATHEVTMDQQPSVRVLVDGRRVATLQLHLAIVFDISVLVARISAGRLTGVYSGRCDVTATLAVQGTTVLTKRADFQLPGAIPLKPGARLLPENEYPVGREHTSSPPSALVPEVTPDA